MMFLDPIPVTASKWALVVVPRNLDTVLTCSFRP
jgi:hypothetical protein